MRTHCSNTATPVYNLIAFQFKLITGSQNLNWKTRNAVLNCISLGEPRGFS